MDNVVARQERLEGAELIVSQRVRDELHLLLLGKIRKMAAACVSKRPPLPEDIWQMVGSYLQRPTRSAAILESYFTKLGVFTATEMVRLASGRLMLVDSDCPPDDAVRRPISARIVEWFQHAAGRANWAEMGRHEAVFVWCPRTADCPTTKSGPYMSSPCKKLMATLFMPLSSCRLR